MLPSLDDEMNPQQWKKFEQQVREYRERDRLAYILATWTPEEIIAHIEKVQSKSAVIWHLQQRIESGIRGKRGRAKKETNA